MSPWIIRLLALSMLVSAGLAQVWRAAVNNNGGYMTSVDVEVPAFHRIEPHVALSYDSHLLDGPVGMDWRLDVGSTITRAGAGRGAPKYDASDLFLLDGEELVACTSGMVSPSCMAGGTHATRVESFRRISYDGANDRWTVWRKDGTSSTYMPQIGPSSTATYRWALSHVQDTHGNGVDYAYWCDGADECYLSSITYGGGVDCGTIPDGTVGTRLQGAQIQFLWQPRASVVSQANGSSPSVTSSPRST